MKPYYEWGGINIFHGDSLDVLPQIPADSVDLIVTDPPYGLSFMGKSWDKAVPSVAIWQECLRALKPGSFAFVMCIPRQDCLSRMVVNLQDAGFETGFTSMYWAYASGFPKAGNIGKLVDKRAGAEREAIAPNPNYRPISGSIGYQGESNFRQTSGMATKKDIPATPQAQALDGSYAGFQPKPAVEVILVAMKPLSEKTYVDQALANGKGITWLDGGRIPIQKGDEWSYPNGRGGTGWHDMESLNSPQAAPSNNPQGRFAPNLLVSDDVLNDGRDRPTGGHEGYTINPWTAGGRRGEAIPVPNPMKPSSGSFSRYFSLDAWWEKRISELPASVQKTFPFLIVPKASKAEKNRGCEGLPERIGNATWEGKVRECRICGSRVKPGGMDYQTKVWPTCGHDDWEWKPELINGHKGGNLRNHHATVKPVKLMAYLIILGSREGDTVLDPFLGSGTTLVAAQMLGRKGIGIELEAEYAEIAMRRLPQQEVMV